MFEFIYKAKFDNELTEHEYDWTFIGKFDGEPKPDINEIADFKWVSLSDVQQDINKSPKKYSKWFKTILEKLDFDEVKKRLNI